MVSRHHCEQIIEKTVREYGMTIIGWRDVPVDRKYVGPTPRKTEP
jgi:glutamate synthase domain-containing protein 1